MTKPAAKDLDEEGALREVIDALRADDGRLLRLLIAGFVSDGRPEHKELTEVLAHYPQLATLVRHWRIDEFECQSKSSHAKGRQR
jgi:hypothetical protein